jgi:RNA polymerase sigma factor, sigma-70 family
MSDTLTEEWFRAAYQQSYQPVVAYLRRRIPSNDVEDLLSVIMTRVWQTRDTIPPHLYEDPLPWFFGVAHNVVNEYFRTSARRLDHETIMDPSSVAHGASAIDVAEGVAEGSRVKAALDLLSDSDRDVLLLAAWEGLTTVELASALQVTPAAARVRLHRARTRFAEALHTVEEQ